MAQWYNIDKTQVVHDEEDFIDILYGGKNYDSTLVVIPYKNYKIFVKIIGDEGDNIDNRMYVFDRFSMDITDDLIPQLKTDYVHLRPYGENLEKLFYLIDEYDKSTGHLLV